MKGLAATSLRSFKEVPLGHEIRVFGNVAVAVSAGKSSPKPGTRKACRSRYQRTFSDLRDRGREPSCRPLNRPVTGRNDDSGPSNGPLKPPFHAA
jgi:hypothetical protein